MKLQGLGAKLARILLRDTEPDTGISVLPTGNDYCPVLLQTVPGCCLGEH